MILSYQISNVDMVPVKHREQWRQERCGNIFVSVVLCFLPGGCGASGTAGLGEKYYSLKVFIYNLYGIICFAWLIFSCLHGSRKQKIDGHLYCTLFLK